MTLLSSVYCLAVMLYSEGSILTQLDRFIMAQIAFARTDDSEHGEVCFTIMQPGQFHFAQREFDSQEWFVRQRYLREATHLIARWEKHGVQLIDGARFFTHNAIPPGNRDAFDLCAVWQSTWTWALKGRCWDVPAAISNY